MHLLSFATTTAGLASFVAGQFPPAPEGLKVVESKREEGVKISYKEPGICETTPNVKSYTGYVHLPPGTLADVNVSQPYPINTFFWFFESRKDPHNAPLSIWLNGGPGSSSLIGLFQEHGPCKVLVDSNSTELNHWSWNNEVNMLYIDQPNQVGFSYDVPTNGTFDQLTDTYDVSGFAWQGVPEQNNTFYLGTFASQRNENTANNTENAARSLWHFAQMWFDEFPEYKPQDDRVSIWTESYGGRYGPGVAAFFQEQNGRIESGTLAGDLHHYIHLDTLGIINGCIDLLVQAPYYAEMAFNNTYGIQAINQTLYERMVVDWSKPDGCRDRILECRRVAAVGDPHMYGNNETVNEACMRADQFCTSQGEYPYIHVSGRSYYDISHPSADPFPPPYGLGFLSQHWVQQALGVPVNFTFTSQAVYKSFQKAAEYPRRGFLEDLAYLLDSGIKVALVYGDRDYACPWNGGEAVSLAVKHAEADKFHAAGYSDVHTNESYVGGLVRQHNNFSFTRVFQAGHEVPAYQPATAYEIFHRTMFNRDIATGLIDTTFVDSYSSTGPSSTWQVKDEVPESPQPKCYVLAMKETCTENQANKVANGGVIIEDYFVAGQEEKKGQLELA